VSLFTPEDWERLQDLVKEEWQTGAPYEPGIEIVSREPKAKWVTARGEPLRDAGNQIIGLRGTVQDITERKRQKRRCAKMRTNFDFFWTRLPKPFMELISNTDACSGLCVGGFLRVSLPGGISLGDVIATSL